MRSLRVFPRRTSYTPTDGLAFVGDPPLFPRYAVTAINVSVVFSWDRVAGERLAEAWQAQYPEATVRVGGPAYDDPGDMFMPGEYVKAGIVHTSRGCNNKCPWCVVPQREGRLRLLPLTEGYVVSDNNLLQCPREHRLAVYEMLSRQSKGAEFRGGIDARLVNAETAAELRDVRITELFLAADSEAGLGALSRASERLHFLTRRQKRCYVLVGWQDDTPERAASRLEACWQMGVLPFAQYFRGPETIARFDYPRAWRELVRTWSRPAAMMASHAEAVKCNC